MRDSLIGDESLGIKGISGGEKRRVSVGVEVVKDPAIIFLDEPTTGLDSEMALGVITSLKTMAEAGKMVSSFHSLVCAGQDCVRNTAQPIAISGWILRFVSYVDTLVKISIAGEVGCSTIFPKKMLLRASE